MIVIKRGLNGVSFRLSKKTISLNGEGFINNVDEKDWEEALSKYGSFITPRIVSEKNPNGVFVINENKEKAIDQNKEVDPIIDNAAPVDVEAEEEKILDSLVAKKTKPIVVKSAKKAKK